MSNARNLSKAGASAVGGMAPTGVVLPFAGSAAPTGWLLCDGAAVSRTTYADLFATISTTYGAGDGSTTFALPDLKGRVPAGKEVTATRLTAAGSGINGATLGATGGAETHTLTVAQMPAHTHDAPGRTDRNTSAGGSDQVVMKNGASTITAATNSNGSGSAHNNTQPTIVLNYIIKT